MSAIPAPSRADLQGRPGSMDCRLQHLMMFNWSTAPSWHSCCSHALKIAHQLSTSASNIWSTIASGNPKSLLTSFLHNFHLEESKKLLLTIRTSPSAIKRFTRSARRCRMHQCLRVNALRPLSAIGALCPAAFQWLLRHCVVSMEKEVCHLHC